MRKVKSVLSFICVICVLCSAFSITGYASAAVGYTSAEQISVEEAIVILDQAFSNSDDVPSNEQRQSLAAWFDPTLVMGRYDTLITRAFASYMLLSAAGIEAPPAAIYSSSTLPELKNVYATYLKDSFVTCIEMDLFRTNTNGDYEPNALIDRAELVEMITSLQNRGLSLPKADFVPEITAEVYGFSANDSDYQTLSLQAALLSVPEALAQNFIENGWHITVSSESYYKTYVSSRYSETAYLTASGLFMPREKMILLQNRASEKAVHHEFGHYFARYFAASKDLDALYDSECAGLESLTKSSYCRTSSGEYFAEAFRIYVSAPSSLEQKCPLTFTYVDNLICSMDKAA